MRMIRVGREGERIESNQSSGLSAVGFLVSCAHLGVRQLAHSLALARVHESSDLCGVEGGGGGGVSENNKGGGRRK